MVRLGLYEEAYLSFTKALDLEPNHKPALSGKSALLLRVGNFNQGLLMLEKAEGIVNFDLDKGVEIRGEEPC